MSIFDTQQAPDYFEKDTSVGQISHFKEWSAGAGSEIAKLNKDGFFIGADNFADAPFSVNYSGVATASSLTLTGGAVPVSLLTAGTISSKSIVLGITDGAGDSVIRAGKTDFTNTETGFILGVDDSDSNKPKFYIGDTTKYLNWDGSALTIRGTLNADDIVAGTLTGRTVKAVGTGVAADVWMDSADGSIKFYYGGSLKSYIISDASGNLQIDSDETMLFTADGAGDDIFFDAGDDIFLSADDDITLSGNDFGAVFTGNFTVICDQPQFFFNDDNDGSDCVWVDVGGGTDTLMRLDQSDESLYIDGTFVDTGADFAEFFEATQEFSNSKIPYGTSVVLVGDKIRPAKNGEVPFGVISVKPTIIGNSGGSNSDTEWGGKYLKDEFGDYILEEAEWWKIFEKETVVKENGKNRTERSIKSGFSDIQKPPKGATRKIVQRKKVNPNWNPKKKYVSRKDRPEWNVVGLIGRLRMKKGQPVAPNWIKMRNITPQVEEWLVR